jgi:hypothetical protein
MKVINIHERAMPVPIERVGALIDSLGSKQDGLWPGHSWPPMAFDRPLGVGAVGGHGPIGYTVEGYEPGLSARFRFSRPKGFDGFHGFDVRPGKDGAAVLRHTLDMHAHGTAIVAWPMLYRPLHDALAEDALTTAQASLGIEPEIREWAWWIHFLRRLVAGGRVRRRVVPGPSANQAGGQ